MLAIYYHETDYNIFTTLKAIAKCFGIPIPEKMKPQGVYLDLFRLVDFT